MELLVNLSTRIYYQIQLITRLMIASLLGLAPEIDQLISQRKSTASERLKGIVAIEISSHILDHRS